MTAQALTVITGASRGLGLAMAQELLQRGHRVLTLQRHPHEHLQSPSPGALVQWAADLREPEAIAQRLSAWLKQIAPHSVSEFNLIHNAALLSDPGDLCDTDIDQIAAAVRVGLEAPLVLTAVCLQATASWTVPRKVLNISSGLGRRAMAGSSVYCAVKAGMDHYSRALALEEAAKPNAARVVSLAPGVIDTDMQVQLRSASPARFAEQARFAALKTQGQLDSPQQAAIKVLAYLHRADFGDQVVADVRDA